MRIDNHRTIATIVAAIVLLLSACSRPNDEGLKIAYLPTTHSLPLLAVNELQHDGADGANAQLLKFGSWNELSDAFNTRSVDGAVVLAEIALKMRENGVPLKAVALGHHDGNVVVAANDIDSVADLRGRTVAIPHRLSSHNIILQMILRRAGVDPSEVEVTELPPPEMPAALSEGRISAYIVAEPFGAKGVVSGVGKVLFTSPEVWEHSVCCTLVLRQEAIDDRRAEVEHFVDEYKRAADSLSVSQTFAKQVAKKHLKVGDEVIDKSLEWIDFADLAIRSAQYDTLSRWMQDLNMLRRNVAFADFADTILINR